MRGVFGCAGAISVVAFLLGLIGAQFATQASLSTKLMLALLPAGMAFMATLLLCGLDRLRYGAAIRSVRRVLLKRHDISDNEYAARFPDIETLLSIQTRQAVASLFQVPATKIYPDDQLRSDLRFDTLEYALVFRVVPHVLAARQVIANHFTFNNQGLASLGDLAREIQRILDSTH